MTERLDPVRLSVFRHLFAAVAEEMGVVLGRSSFSPNIKERRDFSCGVFDDTGRLAAQAAHIPVHLGSMPLSVRAAPLDLDLGPGHVAILNDPFRGGTHLPDITMVSAVFVKGRRRFHLANRAHHADVGGSRPGSMSLTRSIYEEGFRMPPVLLAKGGEIRTDVLKLLLANVRTPREREGDIAAQRASLDAGERRIRAMVDAYGADLLGRAAGELMDYTERMLIDVLRSLPDGRYEAFDHMDDDGVHPDPVPIRVAVTVAGGRVTVDFTGSSPQTSGGINANRAVTLSAVMYVLRCLLPAGVPSNDGLLRPLDLVTEEGSVVDAVLPAAVAGGNVETSQRIVDVTLRAFAGALPERIPASSAGTMCNLSMGGSNENGEPFSYYETIAGGAGAGPRGAGRSGVQTHMTNTLNTRIRRRGSASRRRRRGPGDPRARPLPRESAGRSGGRRTSRTRRRGGRETRPVPHPTEGALGGSRRQGERGTGSRRRAPNRDAGWRRTRKGLA
jgi:N-methylhydantoinase B